jgi:hypothetical protein
VSNPPSRWTGGSPTPFNPQRGAVHQAVFYQAKLDAGLASGSVRLMHGILHKALE